MLRMALKDLFLLKRTVPFIGAWFAFMLVSHMMAPTKVEASGSVPPGALLAIIPIFLAFILMGNAIAMDDKYKLDATYCSLPIKRTEIVSSRYISTFAILAAGVLISSAVGLFLPRQLVTLKVAFFVFFFLSMFFSLLLPIYFRFGFQLEMELGKIAAVVVLIGFMIVMLDFFSDSKMLRDDGSIVYLALFLVLFVFASLKVSQFFYKRREF